MMGILQEAKSNKTTEKQRKEQAAQASKARDEQLNKATEKLIKTFASKLRSELAEDGFRIVNYYTCRNKGSYAITGYMTVRLDDPEIKIKVRYEWSYYAGYDGNDIDYPQGFGAGYTFGFFMEHEHGWATNKHIASTSMREYEMHTDTKKWVDKVWEGVFRPKLLAQIEKKL